MILLGIILTILLPLVVLTVLSLVALLSSNPYKTIDSSELSEEEK